ncbi:hypothetical protein IW138_005674 [Coemansia sp. RSA 986]|nr:hypothetical protein IW138_005674 [Coemansia sp. RSA 986]
MTTISTIKLGIPGDIIRLSRIGLGTVPMSVVYGAVDDDESVKTLNHAIDIGCTFWDTADTYDLGHDERLLFRVLKKRRKEVFLCTKFGLTARERKSGDGGNFIDYINGINGKPDYVRQAAEDSLEHLGIDYIDLYCIHRVDPTTPIEETVAAMAELVKEGKVRFVGLSKVTPDQIRRVHKVHPIAAADGVLDTCRELGITVVVYSPLGHGVLAGNIRNIDDLDKDDWRRTSSPFRPVNFENNLKLIDSFESMVKKYNRKPEQLALAWLLAQYDNMIAIPRTKRSKYLEEDVVVGQIKLSDDELQELRKLVDIASIQDARY